MLLFVLCITVFFVNYKSFEIINHKFWLASLIIVNISVLLFIIIFYYKKTTEPGARGFKGYQGVIGGSGDNYESCSADV
jgi:hypothetical protein